MTPFDILMLAMLSFVVLVLAVELLHSRLKRPPPDKRRWTQVRPPDER